MPDHEMDLDKIKKDAKLCGALMNHMKKEHTLENFLFYFAKGNPEGLYAKFISPKAKDQVNLPSKIQKAADTLAKRGDWEHKEWPKILKAAKRDIKGLVEGDVLPRFYKSKFYMEYCAKEKMGDPKKAAKLLGISNVKLLTEGMVAVASGNTKEAEKLLTKLAKEEKMKEKAKDLISTLEKSGLCG